MLLEQRRRQQQSMAGQQRCEDISGNSKQHLRLYRVSFECCDSRLTSFTRSSTHSVSCRWNEECSCICWKTKQGGMTNAAVFAGKPNKVE